MNRGRALALLATFLIVVGCEPATSSTRGPVEAVAVREPGRTLVVALRVEPTTLASLPLARDQGLSRSFYPMLFNATLSAKDQQEVAQPYLAEALPQLDQESWRVLPDGRMETIYRLRPGISWHDGVGFSADDFVFAWRVYQTPEFGQNSIPPFSAIEQVSASDDRTLLIRWRQLYTDAGVLDSSFPPLPRHILEPILDSGGPDALASHPFWSHEYVGLGPYAADRWEPGSYLEAAAFDGFVFGRPKMQRLRLLFIGDPNSALANLLAGEVHLAIEDSIRFQQGSILLRDWVPSGAGIVYFTPSQWRFIQVQLRPEYAAPRAILDVRVRKALAHSVDKQAISDALFDGQGVLTDSMIPASAEYAAALDSAIAKYPMDPARAEQLMAEAGFARGPNRFFVSSAEGRIAPEIKTIAASQNEAEMSTLASGWREVGFDAQEAVISPSQAQDPQIRATFRTLHLNGGPLGSRAVASQLTSARIPGPENRWTGSNRGGWVNPAYDRLTEGLETTLDRSERNRRIVEAVRIYSEELPALSLYFQLTVIAHAAGLRGVRQIAPEGSVAWNVHAWEFQ